MLSVGSEFLSIDEAKRAIQDDTVNKGQSYKVYKSDSKRHIVVCKEKGCPFRVRASKIKEVVRITIMEDHTCSPFVHRDFQQAHSVSFVAEHHREAVRDYRNIAPKQIQSSERLHHGNHISYRQAHRVRDYLRGEVEGDEAESFQQLPALIERIKALSPHNYARCQTTDGQFYRYFVAPIACRIACENARPLILLDGCHTKSRYRMILLIATMFDPNDKVISIAWALVPTEDGEQWLWFLRHLIKANKHLLSDVTVVISDRDKGLALAVHRYLPQALHLHCCQHLAANVQTYYGLACRALFWQAAYASTENAFQEAMKKLKELKKPAYDYLNAIPVVEWATHASSGSRYRHNTTNSVESINAAWNELRELPAIPMMLTIWAKIMNTVHTRSVQFQVSTRIVDQAKQRLELAYKESRRYHCYSGEGGLVQVMIPDGDSQVVDLRGETCTCQVYQDMAMPCKHAVAACFYRGEDPYDYVHCYYAISTYRDMYSVNLHPLQGDNLESTSECVAPITTRLRGRPKKRRHRRAEEGRVRKPIRCGHCKQQGHNQRSCRNAAAS